MLYNMCASILQSVGDSRSPMKYLILASLTNVVLDLLFVAVFRWGVASAALATILSQTLSALLAFRKLTHTGHSYRLSWRQVRFHGDMLRQVVYLGIPSGVQNSVISLANVIVQANITPSARRPWRAAVPTAKSRALPFCRSPAFPWPWPPL